MTATTAEPSATTIAFIGLGRMGEPMAARLIAAGYPLIVSDLNPEAVQRLVAAGAKDGGTATQAASGADVVITILPGPPAVEQVASGDDGLIAGWVPGRLWIEMTSSRPETTKSVAERVAAAGGLLLDAPVSGGVAGAREGKLTIMLAGAPEAQERARPILEHLGINLVDVGAEPGLGDLVKTLNNMLSAVNLTAASEAVGLALRGGLALDKLVEVVSTSTGASNAMTKIGKHVLPGTYEVGFTIDQYLKDLGIALEADDAEAELARTVRRKWQQLSGEGHGGEDHTRIVPLLIDNDNLS